MEEKHKCQITRFSPKIVDVLNYETFKEKCIKYEIVTPIMVANIEAALFSQDENTKFRALLTKITHRGPNSFGKVIVILMEMCLEIMNILFHFQSKFQNAVFSE